MEIIAVPIALLVLIYIIAKRAERDPLNYDRFEDPSNPKENP